VTDEVENDPTPALRFPSGTSLTVAVTEKQAFGKVRGKETVAGFELDVLPVPH
jgi:hypothetical protein